MNLIQDFNSLTAYEKGKILIKRDKMKNDKNYK
jgi:hypothetical protein